MIGRSRRALLVLAVAAASIVVPNIGTANHVHGGPTNFVTLSDGTSIAVNVVYPSSFDAAHPAATKYPAILEMAGYENGSSSAEGRTFFGETADHCRARGIPCPEPPLAGDSHEGTAAFRFDAEYVSVHASVRGTGCSSGQFDLFKWPRTGLDGKEIIDNWIVKQPWSNGDVGILGHSYSGNTGFMIAATRPAHLRAITVSGVIDDVYRGITYPGGVFNNVFPALWAVAIRQAYDTAGGSLQPLVRHKTDPIAQQCAKNIATHTRAFGDDPLLHGTGGVDGPWWRKHSNYNIAHLINVPIHITGAFQDEQTGPRFPHLWEMIPTGVPKRLLMTNGDHGTQVGPDLVWRDRKAWMDYWMRGVSDPYVDIASKPVSVRTLLELHNGAGGLVPNGIKDSTAFPLTDTAWTPFFLGPNGTLSTSQGAKGTATYLSGTKRQSWFFDLGPQFGPPVTTKRGPDELDFISAPFATNTLMDGPITANLYLDTTANDTELFVQVTDRDAKGNVSFLQRGLLKASHRAIDASLSDYSSTADPLNPSQPYMYRPWRPHIDPKNVTPRLTKNYLIEIFPVAHVFRPGHRLQIKIMSPPLLDSEYGYAPRTVPIALNTVHFGGATPSRITLPLVSLADLTMPLGPALACGDYWQVRCFPD
jgi:uncharacterized protein